MFYSSINQILLRRQPYFPFCARNCDGETPVSCLNFLRKLEELVYPPPSIEVGSSLLRGSREDSSFWNGGSCVWGDAATIMPWTMYTHYGDSTILERQYPSMKGWIDWILRKYVGPTGLWDEGFHFGDWLALDGNRADNRLGGTDEVYIASVYLKHSSELTAKAAHVLGLAEEEAYYRQISDRTRAAIQKAYFTENGHCTIRTQTANILALAMDIVGPEARKTIAADLVTLLRHHSPKGMIGIRWEKVSADTYSLYVKVPFDSATIVELPGTNGEPQILTAGEHHIDNIIKK